MGGAYPRLMEYVRPFSSIGRNDVAAVGGKNASLGEMYRELVPLGVLVPNGFAVTADAYREVLRAAGAWPALHEALDSVNPADIEDLARRAQRAYDIVIAAPLPEQLVCEISAAYAQLLRQYGPETTVAVRSSATAEDLPNASFAGQHETFLNVRGEGMLLEAYRKCIASLFLERAIHYRIDKGFDHFKVALSVGVMKMVRADLAASGVAFTLDTESGFRDVVMINASYGLGENIVQGSVDPDEFYVHKPTYDQGFRAVLQRRLGTKTQRLVFADEMSLRNRTRNEETPKELSGHFCLTDDEVLELGGYCIAVERHYDLPMDVEWAKDGIDGRIYLVQARPETVASRQSPYELDLYRLDTTGTVLARGRAVGSKIGAGPVRVIRDVKDLPSVRDGDVIVAPATTPDWEPVMRVASAIVTDHGGRTCHAAIVARELGIPAIVGTGRATEILRDGLTVTVSCANGESGEVFEGTIPWHVEHVDVRDVRKPPTAIMTILADPASAFERSKLPVAGVGLVRIEFVISGIGIHPMALAHPERVDEQTQKQIAEAARAYPSPSDYFVYALSEGVGTIAAAFYPRPVIVRMSDFKTNEYARLTGGYAFEPHEENPMLGFRGASRYAHPNYTDGFALECRAMKRVREEMGLRNVILMIPFCRRIDEARRVIARMDELGLRRSDGLDIYVMCEIPNNVVLIDEFSKHFDGFSIGSNDLTQLTLGVDRDSEVVAFDFDERDPGVTEMLRQAIVGAKRNGRHIGICGQAPSDYPEMAQWLVAAGIDSISLNPDSVLSTMAHLQTTPAEVPAHA